MTDEQLQAENAALRREMRYMISCMSTVRISNTPDWMAYISKKMNECLERIGDKDRVVVSGDGLRIVRGE